MASGREAAHENFQRFTQWIASKTDENYRAIASRGVLSRKEIARECGFAKSVLRSPVIGYSIAPYCTPR